MTKLKRGLARAALLALTVCLCLLAGGALAETVRVLTPGGRLNVRKTPSDKARLVISVPNRTMVEVVETEEEEAVEGWTKITYKKKTGYVHSEFLMLPEHLVGQTVYPDEGTVLLRLSPDADAPLRGVAGVDDPMEITAVTEGWALAYVLGDAGWVETASLSYQRTEPRAQAEWLRESGVTARACSLLSAPEGDALAELAAGTGLTVTVRQDGFCLVLSEEGWGYLPMDAISLTGPQDSAMLAGDKTPAEATEAAEEVLRKKYKAFGSGHYYTLVQALTDRGGLKPDAYWVGFFSDGERYCYGALIDAETGKALLTEDAMGFAAREKTVELLPYGEVQLRLSADTLAVGDVLDLTVRAWTTEACRYAVRKDDTVVFEGEDTPHFAASWRPRSAGDYQLTVTVTDADGHCVSASKTVHVAENPGAGGTEEIYSQKDGWWADKAYRKSHLEKSGCAIFTLSHALHLMGITGPETEPAALASAFALCLTPDGTNNERLMNESSRAFGFSTKRDLYEDGRAIRALLKEGAMFTFSIVRGHIALICGLSDDGTMVRIVDSAPSATYERIINGSLFYQTRSGSWREALTLDDLPGARWYFETDSYGGLTYWMRVTYVARRGVRLIMPAKK